MDIAFCNKGNSNDRYIIEYDESEKFKAKRKETEEQKRKLIEKALETKSKTQK